MTLKEKFKDITEVRNHNWFDILVNKLEKIADDYAIEFKDWLDLDETQDLIEDLKFVGELSQAPKTKELLEIFKKEKYE
jgi:hypothetical protein